MGNTFIKQYYINGRNIMGSESYFDQIPDEVFDKIFSFISTKDLLQSSMLVCQRWNFVLRQFHFWYRRFLSQYPFELSEHRRHFFVENSDDPETICDLQKFCFHKPFGRNLLQNPSGVDRFQHWNIRKSGDGIVIEDPPVGTEQVPEEVSQFFGTSCFATSYSPSSRCQTINLIDFGLSSKIMNQLKPKIIVSEWVSARFDCGGISQLQLGLQKKDEEIIEKQEIIWSSEDHDVLRQKWYRVEICVENYCDNIERLIFLSIGKDTQFWAGNYGAKTTASSLVLTI